MGTYYNHYTTCQFDDLVYKGSTVDGLGPGKFAELASPSVYTSCRERECGTDRGDRTRNAFCLLRSRNARRSR